MARIRRRREVSRRRCEGAGWRNSSESILAGPAQGSNSVTVRELTIETEGATPRKTHPGSRIVHLLSGTLFFMDGDGTTHLIEEGDTLIVDPGERHHLVNGGSSPARLMVVELQRGT